MIGLSKKNVFRFAKKSLLCLHQSDCDLSQEANPVSELKAFHKHVATTCTLSNKLNIKILSGYSQLTIVNYIFLQFLKFSALLIEAIFPQWLS